MPSTYSRLTPESVTDYATLSPDPITGTCLSSEHEKRSSHSPVLLLAICLLTVGSHFGRHFISSMGPLVMERLHISRSQYGLVFSVEEFPSIFLPLASGMFISALRLRYGPLSVFLACVLSLGQIVTAAGIQARSYSAVILGRVLFGMTDAVLVVVQGAIVGKCFGRGNISTAFGATLFFSRFGSFAGFAAPGFLAERFGLVWSMWISALVCFLSVSASVTYLILEQRHDSASGVIHAFSGHAPSPSLRDTPSSILAIIFIPKRDFWVLVYVWSAISSAVFTVLHFGADIASTGLRIGHASSRAGLTSGLVLLFAGFASPMFGWFQDHVGHRIYLLSIALALCCTGILFGIVGLMVNAWLFAPGIALLAVGFSIAPVTLLSCVSLVVEHDSLPAALGLYKATENLALSLTHWIAGLIRDVSSSYSPTLAFLAIIAASGSAGALLLKRGQTCRILDESAAHDDVDEVTMFEVLDTGL